MKVRIKFAKSGVMKFIGHLDMMRYFQKAMRRADIDIKYSEGFSPHQIMSFAAPLGVGITSDGEYLDIEVNSTETTEQSIVNLNSAMVDGVKILEYKKLPDPAKNAMSIVAAADYKIYIKDGYENPCSVEEWRSRLNTFFYDRAEVLITKKTKKSEKELDIRPFIYKLSLEEKDEIFMQLAAGSSNNTKPELVMEAFAAFMEIPYENLKFMIHRCELYADTGSDEARNLVSLEDLGEEIE